MKCEMERAPSPETIASALTSSINSARALGHVCNLNRCKIVNLDIEIHKKDSTYGVRSRYLPAPPFSCTKDTFVEKVYSIYLCEHSGKIHYCHSNCDGERILNDHDCMVCCISGIQYQSESVRSWKITSRCVASVSVNKLDPYKYSRDKEGRVRLSGVHNVKITQCILIAREIMHLLLFSPRRFANEGRKSNEVIERSKKIVNKYRRHCERNKITKNYMHMITMYIANKQKRPNSLHIIQKTKREIDEIIKTYTARLIGYWKMILYKTELGQTMSSMFPFKTFVPAALYLLKEGVQMNGVFIMEKSRFLESALPETNTLDAYNISKPAFTQSRNKIQEAIRESVESKLTTPSLLSGFAQSIADKVTRENL